MVNRHESRGAYEPRKVVAGRAANVPCRKRYDREVLYDDASPLRITNDELELLENALADFLAELLRKR